MDGVSGYRAASSFATSSGSRAMRDAIVSRPADRPDFAARKAATSVSVNGRLVVAVTSNTTSAA